MSWTDLAARVRKFDIATAWDSVPRHGDPRVREYLSVVQFMVGHSYLAAVNICTDGSQRGDWYTTVTDQNGRQLPVGGNVEWSEIVSNGADVQVATAWEQLT